MQILILASFPPPRSEQEQQELDTKLQELQNILENHTNDVKVIQEKRAAAAAALQQSQRELETATADRNSAQQKLNQVAEQRRTADGEKRQAASVVSETKQASIFLASLSFISHHYA